MFDPQVFEVTLKSAPLTYTAAQMFWMDLSYVAHVTAVVIGRYAFLCGFSYLAYPIRNLVTRVPKVGR